MYTNRYKLPQKLVDEDKVRVHGPVKQAMQTTYKAFKLNGQVVQGKIHLETTVDGANEIHTYNINGVCIKSEAFSDNSREVITYNDEGNSLNRQSYFRGRLSSESFYTYDEQGRMVKNIYNSNGKVFVVHEYTFGDAEQPLEEIQYNAEGQVKERTVMEFGEFITIVRGKKYRNLLSRTTYNDKGEIVTQSTFKYSDTGKRIETITRVHDEKKKHLEEHSKVTLNEHGDEIESVYYDRDGNVTRSYTYTPEYDENGKKIEAERPIFDFNAIPDGETEEVENDHHGNPVKITRFQAGKPAFIHYRKYSYFGEPSENEQEFIHLAAEMTQEEKEPVQAALPELSGKEARWLAEGTTSAEQFPVHRYYALRYKEFPTVADFNGHGVEVFALLAKLREQFTITTVHAVEDHNNGMRHMYKRITLNFEDYPGYMLHITSINAHVEDEYDIPSFIEDEMVGDGYAYFGSIDLYQPPESSVKRESFVEEEITNTIDDCRIKRKPERPYINIIEVQGNSFVMRERDVDDDFEIKDLQMNYGYKFDEFHEDLMRRFRQSTKGLVLFHGEPGTGKTYYIRHLLRSMAKSNKVVIYLPPNMVDHLVEPGFMTFLAGSIRDWSAEGKFCILLIEDAEPLLAKRKEGVRIQGITNLLNLSDGILNDMLNLQIICTFNVDLQKLDSALLRPGRLLARKEFKKLDELDANRLAQRLGIRHRFTEPASLAEVYAMRQDSHTLIHDVASDRDASTILDDL